MPTTLADEAAWETWLFERSADTADVKALVRTIEGVAWTTMPAPKRPAEPKAGS